METPTIGQLAERGGVNLETIAITSERGSSLRRPESLPATGPIRPALSVASGS